MGLSPFKSRAELLAEKTGDAPSPLSDNRFLLWGRLCEETNMQATGECLRARTRGTHVMLESKRCPRVSCTLDGLIAAPRRPVEPRLEWTRSRPTSGWVKGLREALRARKGQTGVLEMKQTGERNRSKWTQGPPEHYWAQVQAQLFVTGYEWGVIAARIGTSDLIAHVVEADDLFFEEMVDSVEVFWEDVEVRRKA